jgi:hypothetical protein
VQARVRSRGRQRRDGRSGGGWQRWVESGQQLIRVLQLHEDKGINCDKEETIRADPSHRPNTTSARLNE